MGQAKLRGSFEERKKAAKERNHNAFLERLKELDRIEAAKTPEQKRIERERKRNIAELMGFYSIGMMSNFRRSEETK